jgi:predicted transcriptional regulator
MTKTIKIGIITKDDFIKRTIAIAKGEHKPGKDEPKIWFESINSFAQLLGDENQALLRIIDQEKPRNMQKLVELTGRKASNLSRTLHTLEGHGIVKLEKNGKEVTPVALATSFHLDINVHRRKYIEAATPSSVKPKTLLPASNRSASPFRPGQTSKQFGLQAQMDFRNAVAAAKGGEVAVVKKDLRILGKNSKRKAA